VAFIAAVGMAGGTFLLHNPQQSLFYFAFAGALLGFLRYNYNPASIFLGDTGSMFIGFVVSTLPMLSQDSNSVLVSVGMPLLAMGVPIFDTSLAILRRILRTDSAFITRCSRTLQIMAYSGVVPLYPRNARKQAVMPVL
jgi:UDP-GlcNAc:undecaprenyl-phosphate GlcNAc-1-phosphate transferase